MSLIDLVEICSDLSFVAGLTVGVLFWWFFLRSLW